uniref:Uncharacterized protein n=1 Tax=Romanomermis culicivorax TaxID=13658 RepID=A0A915I3E5_ROMCU
MVLDYVPLQEEIKDEDLPVLESHDEQEQEKEKTGGKKQESNDELKDKNLNMEAECMAVTRVMTKQMLEPETQETFIDPPPPTQLEIDQTPEEAKKESKLFSLELI